MLLCFEKLLKFEICLKIIMVLKNFTKIIKTIPKKFNEIHQSLSKFITVRAVATIGAWGVNCPPTNRYCPPTKLLGNYYNDNISMVIQ